MVNILDSDVLDDLFELFMMWMLHAFWFVCSLLIEFIINLYSFYFVSFSSLFAAFQDEGKFLLAAKRYRRGSGIEYVLSLDADDMSQGSNAYVGKIRYLSFGVNETHF